MQIHSSYTGDMHLNFGKNSSDKEIITPVMHFSRYGIADSMNNAHIFNMRLN